MSSTKHILLLTPGFPKDENDFNCIPPLQDYLLNFNSTYPLVIISVIAFQYPPSDKPYVWNSISVTPLGGMDGKITKPIIWFKAMREAKRINKLFPIDIVHSLWLGECAIIGNILSKRFGCQHICTLMGQDVEASNRYLKLLKNTSTKFIAISKHQSELFQKLTGKNVSEIIHWGIDDQKIFTTNRDIDLLGVGSLISLKNYSLFIRMIEEIVKRNPELKCMLVGSGLESSKLKSMTEIKRLSRNIEFTGLLKRREIFNLMQRSKILIHPSKFEGFGFVFAEALANGMNIVSFNVGCVQEHPKWSIAKDEQDFIQTTEKLLESKLDFEPVNLFLLQDTVEQYFALYNS